MADDAPIIEVRAGSPADTAYIFSTWMKHYLHSSEFAKGMQEHIYYRYHHHVIERILARPVCQVLVATPHGDPGTIVGYLVAENVGGLSIVHYAYTKAPFRLHGVFSTLLREAGIDPTKAIFTHLTKDAQKLQAKWPGLIHLPCLV